jgi:hypothetical protein
MQTTSTHGGMTVVSPETLPDCASFGFLFPNAASVPFSQDTPAHLRALQEELYSHGDPTDMNNSALAPVFTYLGQFIDHDITSQGLSRPDAADIVDIINRPNDDFAPQPRADVAGAIVNQRTGRLDLDSLYGPSTPTGNAAHDKLIGLLRFPGDRAKMWLGTLTPFAGGIPDRLPLDGAADLLRLGRLMDPPNGDVRFTQGDFDALLEGVRGTLTRDGAPNLTAAVIGDPRNDENLFIAQLHVAFLRFHNRMVDALRDAGEPGNADALFAKAREQVVLHYQWLVMNVYLPSVCDPVALQQVKASGAALYGSFLAGCGHSEGEAFPMPIEFAVAAFRFGHSMVRGNYDWNSAFGRIQGASANRASFELLFAFTGGGENPMFGAPKLPQNWVIDWARTGLSNSEFADRTTRRIDTNVALPLRRMLNEAADLDEGQATTVQLDEKNLAARNLKRGIRMSVPSAQACVAAINAQHGFGLRALTQAELTFGRTGNELEAAGFADATPLWFYTLKEAEMRQAGQRLGALGTHIVAGTIAGLIIHDPSSYWNRPGSIEGRWHPVDGTRASGQLVDSLPAMLRAALLLEV